MILLLVVLAVVLVLVANAWKTVTPTVLDVRDVQSGPLNNHGQEEAGEELRRGNLPRLRETQENTDAHAAQVQEALNAIE